MKNRVKDLDDVDKALRKRSVDDIIERKRGRHRLNERQRQERFRQMLGFLGIPALTLVLMGIILVLDRNPQDTEITSKSESVTAAASEEAETAEAAETAEGAEAAAETEDASLVRQYNDEYMTKLFQDYFNARLQADTDTLYRLTGVTNQTEEQTALLKSQLTTQAGYIEAYQDIEQYAADGLEANTKLVFVTYNVKFRRVDTLAPGIMYCYVKVNDRNEFEIVENMTPEQTKFVNSYITEHSEVQELITATNSRLLEAISSDQRLAVIYDAIQSGRIYTDSQEKIDSEVALISVETEAAAETETSASSETEETDEKETKSSGSSKSSSDDSSDKKKKSDASEEKTTEKSASETTAAKKKTETADSSETIAENTGAGSGGSSAPPTESSASAGSSTGTTIAEPGASEGTGNAPGGNAVISDAGPVG